MKMAQFIKLTSEKNKNMIININHIIDIDGHCVTTTQLISSGDDYAKSQSFYVKESEEEIFEIMKPFIINKDNS